MPQPASQRAIDQRTLGDLRPPALDDHPPDTPAGAHHRAVLLGALTADADGRFNGTIALAPGMGLALFAQVGLVAHLVSLLVPTLGAQGAGLAAGLATAAAILPEGDGYQAALVNFRYIANANWDTKLAVEKIGSSK